MVHVAIVGAYGSAGVAAAKELLERADELAVLGYQGLHLHADVMGKTMQLAVEMALDVRELRKRAYHPTTPEILDGLFREACAELGERQQCVGDPDSPDIGL